PNYKFVNFDQSLNLQTACQTVTSSSIDPAPGNPFASRCRAACPWLETGSAWGLGPLRRCLCFLPQAQHPFPSKPTLRIHFAAVVQTEGSAAASLSAVGSVSLRIVRAQR